MKIKEMTIAEARYRGYLEICVEFTAYDEEAGDCGSETYVYLTTDEVIALRDHLTEILKKP